MGQRFISPIINGVDGAQIGWEVREVNDNPSRKAPEPTLLVEHLLESDGKTQADAEALLNA